MNKKISKQIFISIVIALLFVASIKIFGIAIKAFDSDDNNTVIPSLIVEILCMVTSLIIMFCAHKQDILKGTMSGFAKGISAGGFLCGFAVLLFIGFFVYDFSAEKVLPISNIMIYVFSMLVTGFTEELVFRGVIYNTISECFDTYSKKSVYISMIISSIIFGLMHMSNIFSGVSVAGAIVQAGCAFGVGLYFCAIYVRCNNIWSVIVLHGLNDIASTLNAGVLGERDIVSNVSDYSPLKLIVMVLYIGLSMYVLRDSKFRIQNMACDNSNLTED